jgi:hypothetical protein
MAGMFLTWRFLVCRLWVGLSGNWRLFSASVRSFIIAIVVAAGVEAAGLTRLACRLDRRGRARLAGLGWVVIVAVAAKGSFAAYARRRRKGEYVEQ